MGFLLLAVVTSVTAFSASEKGPSTLPSALRGAFDLRIKELQCQERKEAAEWFARLGLEPEAMNLANSASCQPEAQKLREYLGQIADDLPSPLWQQIRDRKPLKKVSFDEVQATLFDQKKFSALEWRLAREWFGEKHTSELQKKTFPATKNPQQLAAVLQTEHTLWILDPYRKILSGDASADPETLKKEFPKIEVVELSPYGNAESQAEELKNILHKRLHQKINLISSGGASSIVLKTLDLNPSLLAHPNIAAWINVDGQLFGAKAKKSRDLASAVDTFQEKVLVGVRLQYLESLERSPALGKGFPIINVLIQQNSQGLWREKVLSEGEIVQLKSWQDWKKLFHP
jgi:hypothetical protein